MLTQGVLAFADNAIMEMSVFWRDQKHSFSTYLLKTCLALFACVCSTIAFAQNDSPGLGEENIFTKHKVAGAQCADGSAYNYYVRKGDPQKVLVHFQGGGACWDSLTCHGPKPLTRLKDEGLPKKKGYFSTDLIGEHPFVDYTYVFLPYCTGDFFVGSHKANYDGRSVLHYGRANSVKAIEKLEPLIARASKLVLYGDSAGAIGILMNTDLVEKVAPQSADRTMIIDSAGLHFSSLVWPRFPRAYLENVEQAMAANSLKLDRSSGLISKQLPRFCETHRNWKIGVIQSTKDLVMSSGFGMRTPDSHKRQVLGASGVAQNLSDPKDSCSSWVPDSNNHVWAVKPEGWKSRTKDGTLLKDYVEKLLQGRPNDEYFSHK